MKETETETNFLLAILRSLLFGGPNKDLRQAKVIPSLKEVSKFRYVDNKVKTVVDFLIFIDGIEKSGELNRLIAAVESKNFGQAEEKLRALLQIRDIFRELHTDPSGKIRNLEIATSPDNIFFGNIFGNGDKLGAPIKPASQWLSEHEKPKIEDAEAEEINWYLVNNIQAHNYLVKNVEGILANVSTLEYWLN